MKILCLVFSDKETNMVSYSLSFGDCCFQATGRWALVLPEMTGNSGSYRLYIAQFSIISIDGLLLPFWPFLAQVGIDPRPYIGKTAISIERTSTPPTNIIVLWFRVYANTPVIRAEATNPTTLNANVSMLETHIDLFYVPQANALFGAHDFGGAL